MSDVTIEEAKKYYKDKNIDFMELGPQVVKYYDLHHNSQAFLAALTRGDSFQWYTVLYLSEERALTQKVQDAINQHPNGTHFYLFAKGKTSGETTVYYSHRAGKPQISVSWYSGNADTLTDMIRTAAMFQSAMDLKATLDAYINSKEG